MLKKIIRIALFSFLWCVIISAVWAQEFRFTSTADSRGDSGFIDVLNQIKYFFGNEGAFHIIPGDFDPPGTTLSDLRSAFGSDVIWIPAMGNHDLDDRSWVNNHNLTLPFDDINWGPRGCDHYTTFSFDYSNAHFVILDEYCATSSGDIDDALYAWLSADLHATQQPAIFVVGHEPAYPHYRHVGDSLDNNTQHRNRFWQLLHDTGVVAYICGHTHDPEIHEEQGYDTLQVDVGQARGTGSHDSFVDFTVRDGEVEIKVYIGGSTPFYLYDHRIVQIETLGPPYRLTVNTQGQGIVDVDPPEGPYEEGQGVELNALPETGWMLHHWEGDLTGSGNPQTIIMDSPKTVTAIFSLWQPNQKPNVDAGPDQVIVLPNLAILDGTVTDDWQPPPGVVTTTWSQVGGSGTVTFHPNSELDTTASFSEAGNYVLQLRAFDGDLESFDTLNVTVHPVGTQADTLEIRVATGNDDAEEQSSGSVSTGSSDLELIRESSNQTVGIRFNGATIPPRAAITKAYIQFQVDETDSESTSLTIRGQDIGNAPSFSSSSGNISSRARTSASVHWNPAPWTQTGQAGPDQQTPDIALVIQEIVDRSDWFEGNSLVIIITGSGKRVADSYNGSSSGAPLLHVEYVAGPATNRAPSVDAGPDQTITLPNNSVNLNGDVSDDGLPGNTVTTTWSKFSGPGTVYFVDTNAVDTTASFSAAGTYVLELTADDGELTSSDKLTVTVNPPGTQADTLEIRIETGNDDAEERSSGSMYLSSSDLELVYDSGNQKVGMRFNGVTIPRGATITNAYIQFQADESHSGATSLFIQGQDIGNAPIFTSSSGNISSRARTTASVSWNPVSWTTGQAGINQRTPDIASVIREIVSRSDWFEGNSLVIIITGTGERVAESYNGNSSAAPLLHVEYNTGPPPNQPPTVTISAPTDGDVFKKDDTITFTGTATDPEDGDLTNDLEWSSDLESIIGTGGSFSRSDLSLGAHTITASVTDDDGATTTVQITITINKVPTVTIITPADGTGFNEGDTITFSGSALDPEDGDLTGALQWSSDRDGSIGSGGNFSRSNLSGGVHKITVSVIDSAGATTFAQVIITINNAPTVTISTPTDGAVFKKDDVITFTGTATDTEEGDLTAALQWSSDIDGGIGTGGNFDRADLSLGVHKITVSVTDSGLATTTVQITITINKVPTVTINAPTDGAVFNEGDTITFTGSATDPEDGDLTGALQWSSDRDGSIGSGGNFSRSNLSGGVHTITALVIDSAGATTFAQVIITINKVPTVTINAPTDGAVFKKDDVITFTGTATDTEEGDLTAALQWSSDIDGGIGTGGNFDRSDLSLGVHKITVSVTDSGLATTTVQITITINPDIIQVNTIEIRVATGNDDAEEQSGGSVSRGSSDLELIRESSNQTVGIRFNGATIPQGANITNAYIQFQADETDSESTSLTIRGQDIGNAPSFSSSSGNISSRTRTTASAQWNPAPWTQTGQAGPNQQTPDIASVIQEIVLRSDWFEGNSLVIIITGSGKRVADSYNGSSSGAPLLHVEYATGPVPNRAPIVDAGPDQTVTLPNKSVNLSGDVSDDGLPGGTVTTTWSRIGGDGAGTVTFDDETAANTTVSFTAEGTYILQLAAGDSEFTSYDDLTVTVYPEGTQPNTVEIRIQTGNDDAEERSSGSMYRDSSDLELVYDRGNQKVGMRFNGVTIPKGATITNAYIQFQADESHSGTTSLFIQGQDIGNAPIFTSSSGNISSRARTTESVSWNPVSWTTGQAGINQRTPDIASVIREIVSRSDWFEGNSLVIIITGTGERVAESHNGDSSGAPLLHVEYHSP